MKKRKKIPLSTKRAAAGFLFCLPWFLGFIWLYARGIFMAGRFSLSELKLAETGGFNLHYVGLQNYHFAFFEDSQFNQLLVAALRDMVIDVPLIIFFSLFVAIILNGKIKGRAIIRAIFFLPVIMNAGAINDALELAKMAASGGVPAVSSEVSGMGSSFNIYYLLSMFIELGMPEKLIMYLSTAITRIYDIIQTSGVQIIIFIAALQAVSGSMYEVAKIEGATAYETFWKVTLPMVSPLILTNVVYTIVDAFGKSEVVERAYTMAFEGQKWGVSAAMSLTATLACSIVLVVVGMLLSKKVFYYN